METPHDQSAYILDAGLGILVKVHWSHAMNLIVAKKAWALKSDENSLIHSQYLVYARPEWVVLYKYAHIEHKKYNRERVSFSSIMQRDKSRCIYCDKKATTIDHIIPKSRGGLEIAENLAACCWYHNQLKADKTPEEAGLKMLWTPKRVDPFEKEQRRIYKYVEKMSETEYNELYS